MNIVKTEIPEVFIIEPQIFGDDRGFFMESWNQKAFNEAVGRSVDFVQDNHSRSAKNVLRGLHYQIRKSQGKLVRCTLGEVFDVAVDLRRKSTTFGHWVGVNLSADNKRQFWVPEGFAHGFLVIAEVAEFLYKATNYYAPEYERSIIWNDTDLNIQWSLNGMQPSLSEKDGNALPFAAAEFF